MQTRLHGSIANTESGREANAILRKCVHCGFCNATCPTYQLLGDELDGPRGRIYQIMQMFETGAASEETRTHLDRCLLCRNCETTCPSGVQYSRLLEHGRHYLEQQLPRSPWQTGKRWLVRNLLAWPRRAALLVKLGRLVRPVLPVKQRLLLGEDAACPALPARTHSRRVVLLDGCVQPALAPEINAACIRVLDRLGIQTIRVGQAGCCGALSQHLDAEAQARDFMRRNIDAWWPYLATGVEAVISTASACSLTLKDYAHYLRDDPNYADKAQRLAGLARDISEVVHAEDLSALTRLDADIAWHPPCTLQHGLRLNHLVVDILQRLGVTLTAVPDQHLCCGAAGTYSIFQPDLSAQLRDNKLHALNSGRPERIVTANIGCMLQLRTEHGPQISHWIQLLDEQLCADNDSK
ncbi:MAG: glycolate oxidase subunit GlcF [Granulosicoccaceae bacterium]|jgi:glycolate oxidase iron-sulfur subunit